MNVVTVFINGIEYNLKGDEQEEYLHKVASYVDKKVKNILENNSKLSTSSAAILSALNVADDMLKVQNNNDELSKQVRELKKVEKVYEDQINSLKKQLKYTEELNGEFKEKLKKAESDDQLKEKDKQIEKLKEEIEIIKETTQKYIKENTKIIEENKELKFQVQSGKYKIIDLQHKLIENQINLAKEKKQKNPLLNRGSR
ncbi:cell division protein ZapA [Clostridium sp. MT-14]|jgi:cell division protein ZapA|uniref:Cell division protein ZapA n=1 Tax=Clostridium aromativorans TaxID=2836848 RepID=A0ABS8N0G7_9CLOT|nr:MULTISPECIES: cell division protein ZapA [Clostridium]KAA8675793.1 cell division protein ZapA [Clostridium sp. HV4-5-A1G]MCC9293278.1 cell division protein ZapA [Clostridium aromativorans]CAB1251770.1 Cell division protein ZapA [Clostridiaceae bacterium BL-3]